MNTCTFFGHRDCPDSIMTKLRETLVRLITEEGVDCFYVGNQGNFDAMVYRILCELRNIYTHISVTVVLAYMPTEEMVNKYGPRHHPSGGHRSRTKALCNFLEKQVDDKAGRVCSSIYHPFLGRSYAIHRDGHSSEKNCN